MMFRRFQNEPFGSNPLSEKVGVLLVNLGTPAALDYWSLRRYLKQFLSDRRVVENCPYYWQPLLNLVLLQIIPFKSRRNYAPIWDTTFNKSPLLRITEGQTERLALQLQQSFGENIEVAFAFRYGKPSIAKRMRMLKEQGCSRILVLPLYPHYASATTGSVMDDVFAACRTMRWVPSIRMVDPYYADDTFIHVVANSISAKLKEAKTHTPDAYVFSYHGLPVKYVEKGDPYPAQCEATTKLLAERLSLPEEKVFHCYQSRFGKGEWVKPATDETVAMLAQKGFKNICVVAPGFAADCVETIGELDIEARHTFIANGGCEMTYVPCLNDSERGIRLLATLVRKHLHGWIEPVKI